MLNLSVASRVTLYFVFTAGTFLMGLLKGTVLVTHYLWGLNLQPLGNQPGSLTTKPNPFQMKKEWNIINRICILIGWFSNRCISCCCSVVRGSCVCRNGSCPCRRERGRRLWRTWPLWCWHGNHAHATSCTGGTWRLSIRGEHSSIVNWLKRNS